VKKPIVLILPHQHTKLEAKKRIREGMDKLKAELASFASVFEEEWNADTMRFRTVVLKQEVTGWIQVMESAVRVEVSLPWILAALAEKVRGQIEKRGSQILIGKN